MYNDPYGSNGWLPLLIQGASYPKLSTGAVAAFKKSHLLLSETKVIMNEKHPLLNDILGWFGQKYNNFGHI